MPSADGLHSISSSGLPQIPEGPWTRGRSGGPSSNGAARVCLPSDHITLHRAAVVPPSRQTGCLMNETPPGIPEGEDPCSGRAARRRAASGSRSGVCDTQRRHMPGGKLWQPQHSSRFTASHRSAPFTRHYQVTHPRVLSLNSRIFLALVSTGFSCLPLPLFTLKLT